MTFRLLSNIEVSIAARRKIQPNRMYLVKLKNRASIRCSSSQSVAEECGYMFLIDEYSIRRDPLCDLVYPAMEAYIPFQSTDHSHSYTSRSDKSNSAVADAARLLSVYTGPTICVSDLSTVPQIPLASPLSSPPLRVLRSTSLICLYDQWWQYLCMLFHRIIHALRTRWFRSHSGFPRCRVGRLEDTA